MIPFCHVMILCSNLTKHFCNYDTKTNLDFNYFKPGLDLVQLELQQLTLWQGVLIVDDLTLTFYETKLCDYDRDNPKCV